MKHINNIITGLLCFGIITVPTILIDGMNTRLPKFYLALTLSFIISLLIIYSQKIEFRKPWTIGFIGFMAVNVWLCTKVNVVFSGEMITGIWLWPALVSFMVFALFLISLCNMKFNTTQLRYIYRSIVVIGVVMSGYCILQYFRLDQFVSLDLDNKTSLIKNMARVSGTMGHPTVVAPFIAMLIPIVWAKSKKWLVIPMIIAVLITHSQMAIGAMIVGIIIYFTLRKEKWLKTAVIGFVLLSIIGGVSIANSEKIRDYMIGSASGRVAMWQGISKDLMKPMDKDIATPRIYTGKGIGSFRFVFHSRNKGFENVKIAHNEYLEIIYDLGIVGLFLFIMSLWEMIVPAFGKCRKTSRALFTSIVIVAISAVGLFVWHMAGTLFLSLVIIGLINTDQEGYNEFG